MLVSYHDIIKVLPVIPIELYGILINLFNLHFLFVIISIVIVVGWLFFLVHSNSGKTLQTTVLKLSEHAKNLMYYINTRMLILMSSQFVLSNFRMFMVIICILFNNADIVLCAPENIDLTGLVTLVENHEVDLGALKEDMENHEVDLGALKEDINKIKRSVQLIIQQINVSQTTPDAGVSNIQFKRILNQVMDEQKTAVDLKISNLTEEINSIKEKVKEVSSIEAKIVKAQTDATNSLRMSYLSMGFGIVAIIFLAIKK